MSEAIETFRVQVDDSDLEDLRSRLARTRFPDQLDGDGLGRRDARRLPA